MGGVAVGKAAPLREEGEQPRHSLSDATLSSLPVARRAPNRGSPIPLTLGITLLYLGLVVLLPLSMTVAWSLRLDGEQLRQVILSPRVLAAFEVSFGAALVAATVNGVFGFMTAWVLVRYDFPGKRLLDALVDLPFALPTAVAGLTLAALYAQSGWIGAVLIGWGIPVAYTPTGIVVALTFIGLPFVVRTVQPVLMAVDAELEEAAAILGANRWQTFVRVTLPTVLPALLTGVTMALARGLGEYGSVIFIAGNRPFVSEIVPLLIVTKLEQYDVAGATALAMLTLALSFALLLIINLMQAWARRNLPR
ncbi:MAG: sulfate ABC transporter permease subunit CysT [Magnetococcales bacterium]|nr:sulfate ABC transporter permease subunit CysT [Magnetococcales bacterium]